MKKTYLFIFVLILAISLIFAANEGAGTGAVNSGNTEDSVNSNDQGNVPEAVLYSTGPNSESGNASANQEQHEVAVQTMNQGEDSQLKIQTDSEFGSTIKSGEGNAEAKTSMKMSQGEDGKTYAQLSNGMNAEVKVMPDSASQKALEVLNANCEEKGCSIELKEVGKGEETKLAYEVEAKKEVKVLGLFKSQMNSEAQVDAETGEVIKTKHAWWGFLASKK